MTAVHGSVNSARSSPASGYGMAPGLTNASGPPRAPRHLPHQRGEIKHPIEEPLVAQFEGVFRVRTGSGDGVHLRAQRLDLFVGHVVVDEVPHGLREVGEVLQLRSELVAHAGHRKQEGAAVAARRPVRG